MQNNPRAEDHCDRRRQTADQRGQKLVVTMANSHQLLLVVLPGTYAIARFAADAAIPFRYAESFFYSVSKTDQELSLVCEEKFLRGDVKAERERRLIRVESTLAFSLTGIVASLAAPLAEVAVSIFSVSTYDTDYLLVRDEDLEKAIAALERAGHKVQRRTSE